MKPTIITSVLIIVLLIIGCDREKKTSEIPATIETNKKENPLPKKAPPLPNKENPVPQTLKAINIGRTEDFAILAYASISSNPNSHIAGKVGLSPGTRDQIILDPSEVVGGTKDIIGSEDETIPSNLLSNAKVDMVSAYKEAVNLSPDNDKIGLDGEKFNGKNLSPGCYKWNGDLTINNDFIIQGTDTDVWIFKIPAHLKVSSHVHLTLSGGAKASNIFWQVAGSAILESDSAFVGTIIAQQFVEMKNHSKLEGRAFAKNGYVNLDQATINKP